MTRRLIKQSFGYDGDELSKTVSKIDEYIEKKVEGKLKSQGPKGTTLLESALEKEEHRGRLRGIGGQVSKTMYFKIPRGKRCNINVCSQQELNEEKKKNAERDARIAKLEAYVYKTGVHDIDIDEKGSWSVHNENQTPKPVFDDVVDDNDMDLQLLDDDNIYLGKFVELSVESSKNVGTGTVVKVYGPNDKLYKRCMRVVIDEAIHEDALLPYPTEDYESIGDAVGSHVEWPIRLFKLRYEKPKKEKAQENNKETIDITALPKPLRMLYIYGKRSGNNHITIELDENVFGVKHNLYVDMEDIVPFCQLKPISYMCIATYVCFLQSKLNMLPWADMVRFVDPLNIGYIPTTKTDAETANENMEFRARELSKRLIDTKINQIFLAPCNVEYHWILTVIDPNKGEIAILDSLYKGIHDKIWKEVVELALRLFNMEKRKNGKKKPDWTVLKVPKQPDLTQCGFYVMKYMREIVINSHPWTIGSLQSLFNAHEKYSNEEIDVVRSEWADCVQEYIKE